VVTGGAVDGWGVSVVVFVGGVVVVVLVVVVEGGGWASVSLQPVSVVAAMIAKPRQVR
jgi:hypothetical protein